jgi:hypothetical protein
VLKESAQTPTNSFPQEGQNVLAPLAGARNEGYLKSSRSPMESHRAPDRPSPVVYGRGDPCGRLGGGVVGQSGVGLRLP